ncbi:MAG: DHHA1 domain-containing protein [Terriglobales bacterium]
MTKRLYYDQPDLLEFDSVVEEPSLASSGSAQDARPALILRESAFYPTSGGQVHDLGWVTIGAERLRVAEVVDAEDGRVVHYLEGPTKSAIAPGTPVRGEIDAERRRDHMQQHTGQHVLSAAFIELYQMPTVSFHMGDDYCSIDLSTPAITAAQVVGAEKRANEIVFEDRPVTIRYVHRDEAEKLGLRKLPPAERDELRLIEVADFDLSACGGTHVNATGEIGAILLRKTEKTRQGMRVEFVCGGRAVTAARRDYTTLTEAASLFSAKAADVPEMIRKTFEESKELRRGREEALAQLAGAMADTELREVAGDRKIVVRVFGDRDAGFAKLFAQRAARAGAGVVALVASTMNPPGVVFAQTPGGAGDMGGLLKEALAAVGGRGGGSRNFAQGGLPAGCDVEKLLREAAEKIG